jgi:hypothetical protein
VIGGQRSRGAVAARARRGVALVTTLALLALGAALLAGGFASATASARATRSVRASLVASTSCRRALARALRAWSAAEEGLPVGGTVQRVLSEPAEVSLDSADTRLRIQRLSATLFVVAVDVTVPAVGAVLARRRVRLLVRRVPGADTTLIPTPRAIPQWPLGELY